MEILTLINTYGIICVFAIIVTVLTNLFKPHVPQKIRPYLPLILAVPLAIFSPFFIPSVPASVIPWLKQAAVDWVKTWAISMVTYDLVLRLFKASQSEAAPPTVNEVACETDATLKKSAESDEVSDGM